MKRTIATLALMIEVLSQPVMATPQRIILVGDSIMAPETGYGDALCARVVPGVDCVNLAKGGRSSFSYRAEGSWSSVMQRLNEGQKGETTWVLIQFGHNDQPGKPGRSTDLETEYRDNLTQYVKEVRATGGRPVLITPLTRRDFKEGKLENSLAPWALVMRQVAQAEQVPLVDLNEESAVTVRQMGEAEADTLAMAPPPEVPQAQKGEHYRGFDHTHLGAKGAAVFSQMVARDLVMAEPDLASAFTHQASAGDTRLVTEPVMPPTCTTLPAESPSAEQDDTVRVQTAIDHCVRGWGVHLVMGSGHDFITRPLILRAGVSLILDQGVTLRASRDPAAYDRGNHTCGTNDHDGRGCVPFISVAGGDGGGIFGPGVIDGQGGQTMNGHDESWWTLSRRAQHEHSNQNVPNLIVVEHAREFTLYKLNLRNAPKFHVVLNQVNGATVWAVNIDTPADARNTDGIDPVSSRNVTIARSNIRAGDDNIAIKSGNGIPSEHISILHNHFYSGHGMSIGSNTDGGIHDVFVDDLSMDGTVSGLRIKSDRSRGGLVNDVVYHDVCLRAVKAPIDIDSAYDKGAQGDKLPRYENIVFKDVRSVSPGKVILSGLDEAHLIRATFDNVAIAGQPDRRVEHASIQIVPSLRPIDCDGRFPSFPEQAIAP